MMNRRQAIKTTALASVALATLPAALAQNPAAASTTIGPFTLPRLPYATDALVSVDTTKVASITALRRVFDAFLQAAQGSGNFTA